MNKMWALGKGWPRYEYNVVKFYFPINEVSCSAREIHRMMYPSFF